MGGMDTVTYHIVNELQDKNIRAKIIVKGIVQGVGFRPFVYNLAKSLNLKGYVLNSSKGVTIEIEGDNISDFIDRLPKEAPPLSQASSSPSGAARGQATASSRSLGASPWTPQATSTWPTPGAIASRNSMPGATSCCSGAATGLPGALRWARRASSGGRAT